MGELNDGSDSIAVQICQSSHWPEMRVLILVVNDSKKKTSSTGGMARTAQTSELLKHRIKECVPERTRLIIEAIKMKDFQKFGEITMKDSNQFHAVCLDTYTPCIYMNDISHSIVNLIHQYNEACGSIKAAYTFDAGPNCCLYLLEEEVPKIISLIKKVLPNDDSSVEYLKGIPVDDGIISDEILSRISQEPIGRNLLKYIIHTKIGEGPKELHSNESLLNSNGLPKNYSGI